MRQETRWVAKLSQGDTGLAVGLGMDAGERYE